MNSDIVESGASAPESKGGAFSLGRLCSWKFIFMVFAGGLMGEIAVEIVAWWIFPPVMEATMGMARPMQPHILVSNLFYSFFGLQLIETTFGTTVAVFGHLALGLIIFPVIFILARDALGMKGTYGPALIFGTVLWAIAQMILAPLAGRPFMLGLIPYTWGSLFAHNAYTVAMAFAIDKYRAVNGDA